jgi:ornithine--oxo-acid transaminase
MATALCHTVLDIFDREQLVEKACQIQAKWEEETSTWKHPFINFITCRGADLQISLDRGFPDERVTARRIAMLALSKGLLVYPLEGRIRMSVALTITDDELRRGFSILKQSLDEVRQYGDIPGSTHVHDETH